MDTKSLARWLIVLLAILGLVFALAEVGQSWNDSKKETEKVRVEKDKVEKELEQLDSLYQKLKISTHCIYLEPSCICSSIYFLLQ